MSGRNDYYQILGLTPTATPAEVKKRYRELVRKYHPDVNASADAAQKILAINEAYHTLGDVEKRSHYDALRTLSQNSRPTRSETPSSAPSNGTPRSAVDFNGFGTTRPTDRNGFPPQPVRRPGPKKAPAGSDDIDTERLMMEARLAYVNRQFPKAEKFCLEVLKTSPKSAIAHELLGDIYAREGDTSRASTAYSYALQFNPQGRSAQTKMESLVGNRITPLRTSATTFTSQKFATPAVPFSTAAFSAVAVIAVCTFLLALIVLFLAPGGVATTLPIGFQVTYALVPALILNGICSGTLLAFYGHMRPSRLELWKTPLPEDKLPIKLGFLLIVSSLLSLLLSFVIWIVVGLAKKPLSVSLFRAYAVAFAVSLLTAFAYHPTSSSPPQWLLMFFGGNLIFPFLILGWFLGDKFRMRGQLL